MNFWEARGMTMDMDNEEVVDTLNNLMERNREFVKRQKEWQLVAAFVVVLGGLSWGLGG